MTHKILRMISKINWKEKSIAFLIHFGISLVVFIILLYLILFEWYPFPFFSTDGGTQGMRLIFFVDLVLGPALTFIVYKAGKKSLKFDLSSIAVLQTLALGFGVWAIYHERPVAIVFADDRFHPIPYYQVIEAGIGLTELKKYDTKSPAMIFVELPDESKVIERNKVILEAYQQSIPLYLLGERYRQVDDDNFQTILDKSIDIETYLTEDFIREHKDKWQKLFKTFKTSHAYNDDELAYLAFYARQGHFILVLHRQSKKYIEVLSIQPPQATQKVITIKRPKALYTPPIFTR